MPKTIIHSKQNTKSSTGNWKMWGNKFVVEENRWFEDHVIKRLIQLFKLHLNYNVENILFLITTQVLYYQSYCL